MKGAKGLFILVVARGGGLNEIEVLANDYEDAKLELMWS